MPDGSPILSFVLNDNAVSNVEIFNKGWARAALHPAVDVTILDGLTPTADSLCALFQLYMGGHDRLEDYLNSIEAHGFFSFYQPNLRIEIERRS